VTIEQAVVIARRLWLSTDDELLGLGLTTVPRGTFRLVCFGLISAPTVRAAVVRFQSFQNSLPGFPPVGLDESASHARLHFDIRAVSQPNVVVTDTMLALTRQFIAWAIGDRLPLRRVEVPYTAVPGLDDYEAVFGAPVTFGADHPAIVFNATVLDAGLVRDEDDLAEFLRGAPVGALGLRDYSVSVGAQVRRILERGFTGLPPSVDSIAAELAMSPQTLRRRLQEEGTSSRKIREQVLRDTAIASLVRGDETIAVLSRRLGFSEPSAFSRAFRRWTGSSPKTYQR